jgi:hypothetical protein
MSQHSRHHWTDQQCIFMRCGQGIMRVKWKHWVPVVRPLIFRRPMNSETSLMTCKIWPYVESCTFIFNTAVKSMITVMCLYNLTRALRVWNLENYCEICLRKTSKFEQMAGIISAHWTIMHFSFMYLIIKRASNSDSPCLVSGWWSDLLNAKWAGVQMIQLVFLISRGDLSGWWAGLCKGNQGSWAWKTWQSLTITEPPFHFSIYEWNRGIYTEGGWC